ncbi:tetratricopeptide repeat protein [uncultured Shimia sp.]|uniref:tetratricopeptide repeat protein n=1 Tax=uncultured Shimia sp. TaxID=573152 RepID=UPI0025FBFA89|nr:tetratricopeptide repeat protein [uncultured Shimia sp.]
MSNNIRVPVVAFLLFVIISSSAIAQSWEYVPPVEAGSGLHGAGFDKKGGIVYFPEARRWFLFYFDAKTFELGETTSLVFSSSDGPLIRYSMDPQDILPTSYENGAEAALIPISPEILELLQSQDYVTFLTGSGEFELALTGSRAAISRAIDLVELEKQAEADDAAHAIGQAASDEAQARARLNTLSGAVDECDRLTAHPWDKNATALGVSWDDLDGERAVEACAAAFDLGSRDGRVIYQLGRANSKIGYKNAIVYFQQSAWEHDYPAAFYDLGHLHETGLNTPQDMVEAERTYRRGAVLGNLPSMYKLGRFSFEAAEAESSEEQQRNAENLIRSSAIAGYPEALEYYGNLIVEGRSTKAKPDVGVIYLNDASEKGQASASYTLAHFYRDGILFSQNEEKYMFFLKRAAQQGHTAAQLELGD